MILEGNEMPIRKNNDKIHKAVFTIKINIGTCYRGTPLDKIANFCAEIVVIMFSLALIKSVDTKIRYSLLNKME